MTKSRNNSNRQRSGSETKHDRQGLKGGRGLAKKGGAGGTYTWGKPGDEYLVFDNDVEKGDPIYDSQSQSDGESHQKEKLGLAKKSKNHSKKASQNGVKRSQSLNGDKHDFSYLNSRPESLRPPKLSLSDFKAEISKIIAEYFVAEDVAEFLYSIEELDCQILHHELAKRLIISSFNHGDRERNLVSQILTSLHIKGLITTNQICKAFILLFEGVEDDLILDFPMVKTLLANFLARGVADDIIPPAFLVNKYVEAVAGDIVEHAKTLLSMKHGITRLERIWGLNFNSPISALKKEIKLILSEYLISAEIEEAVRSIKALNIPFFHHEVIKRGILLSLEQKEKEQALISCLFKILYDKEVVSDHQFVLGFQRVYQELFDIKLDNPDAETIVEIFATQAVKDKCLTEEQLKDLKIRAHKIEEKEKNELDSISTHSKERAQSF